MVQLPQPAYSQTNNETLEEFTALPEGEYLAQIVKEEVKATKKEDGHYLQFDWKIMEGQYKDKFLFDRLNLSNPNKEAERMASLALNSIAKACGKPGTNFSEEFHRIPVILIVELKDGRNNIRGYKAVQQPLTGQQMPALQPPTYPGTVPQTSGMPGAMPNPQPPVIPPQPVTQPLPTPPPPSPQPTIPNPQPAPQPGNSGQQLPNPANVDIPWLK